jgi:uncharacterized repeat protein (TIGR03803 family)
MVKNSLSCLLLMLCWPWLLLAQAPHAPLLYGQTTYGGPEHKGSVFHFNTHTHAVNVDYNFQRMYSGISPKGDLSAANNGKYYGTASGGGANQAGLIFEWDSISGNYVERIEFSGLNGADPRGGLELFNGKFYGMTHAGGQNNYGVIFEWDFNTNSLTALHHFDSINGRNPDGTLTLVGNVFYGFTHDGGQYDMGVLFSWDPLSNTFTKLHDFNTPGGSYPVGKLKFFQNKLFGMTNKGGANDLGSIYHWNLINNNQVINYSFNGINGQYPLGSLTFMNNKFYGLTSEGGTFQAINPGGKFGVIFEFNPLSGAFAKWKDLGSNNNSRTHNPKGSLCAKDNKLYGVNSGGPYQGGIFVFNPANNGYTELYFNRPACFCNQSLCHEYDYVPGLQHLGGLVLSGNKLLGTASEGGADNAGVIYEFFPDSNRITRYIHLGAFDAKFPRGSLTKVGNKLFGLSEYGGQHHSGNLFSWDLQTQQFSNHYSFDGEVCGIRPQATPVAVNGKLYGINSFGNSRQQIFNSGFSTRGYSILFSYDLDSGQVALKHQFVDQTLYPTTPTVVNQKLYLPFPAITPPFPQNPTSYIKIGSFNPANDSWIDSVRILGNAAIYPYQENAPSNGLTFHDGKFYAMTCGNWSNTNGWELEGSIYSWDTTQATGSTLLFMNDSNTSTYPVGDLIWVDSVFYGLTTGTSSGGIYQNGAFFKWNPISNTATTLLQVGSTTTPVYSNGKFYFLLGLLQTNIICYDPVLDSITNYNLPTFPGSGSIYSWFNFDCRVNQYTRLTEVIPNELPVLITAPQAQNHCQADWPVVNFTISDADQDTLSFQIGHQNAALIVDSTFSIVQNGNDYALHYLLQPNQTGTDTIFLTVTDGYGGEIQFSFALTVHPLPDVTITQNGFSLSVAENNAQYQWLDCSTQNFLSNETNQSFTPLISGSFAVLVSNQFCIDTSLCFFYNPVGIESALAKELMLTPNPAQEQLNVGLSGWQTWEELKIFDLHGNLVYFSGFTNSGLDISGLQPGIYFAEVNDGSGLYRKKLVKL